MAVPFAAVAPCFIEQKIADLLCNIFLFATSWIEPCFVSRAPRTMVFRDSEIAPAARAPLRGIAGRR
jgi:hypothetical protein